MTLDTTGTTDLALPGIEIPSGILPTNATFDAAYCAFKYGSRKDSSNANNAIAGDQYIQVKEEVSGNYTNAIKVPSGTLPIDLAHIDIMGGDIIFGKIDDNKDYFCILPAERKHESTDLPAFNLKVFGGLFR